MAKVTVIVAVYNAEAYLRQCLDSLLAQTLTDVQVICSDDGSTDGSLDILNQYAGRDSRFSVIHSAVNHGPAHARNLALRQAEGEYVAFLDSDDWLSPDALHQAVSTFELNSETDCVLFDVRYIYSNGSEKGYPGFPFSVKSGREAFVDSLTWRIHGVYVARAELYRRYLFDASAHSFSDDNTTRLHYLVSREVRCCTGRYYYRQLPTSVSHQATLHRFDYMAANRSMKSQLEVLGMGDDMLNIYERVRWLVVVDSYMFYFLHRRQFTTTERQEALCLIRRYWQDIEFRRLPLRLRLKFGYIPFRHCWSLFRLQEELYFRLKKLIGRI